jgi:hypothetical protein
MRGNGHDPTRHRHSVSALGCASLYLGFFSGAKVAAAVKRRRILGVPFFVIGVADMLFWFIKANLPRSDGVIGTGSSPHDGASPRREGVNTLKGWCPTPGPLFALPTSLLKSQAYRFLSGGSPAASGKHPNLKNCALSLFSNPRCFGIFLPHQTYQYPERTIVTVTFYDRSGKAVAYSEDGQHVHLFSGEPVAYLDAQAVYSYRGELMGWFEDGWLRDKDGRCIAYSEQATGGPPQPEKARRPAQSVRQLAPVQQRQDPRSLRPIHSNAWSSQTAEEFFSHLRHRWPGGLGSSSAG